MIKADKSILFQKIFHLYNTYWLLKRSFYSARIKGTFPIDDAPALILMNHSSWWDGLISYYLSKTVYTKDSYAMMSEEGLKQFPFFRRLGAFSIQQQQLTSVIQSLQYAVTLLEQQKAIWFYPQGVERHIETRPLALQPGASYLIEKVPATTIIPVTYYYTFLHEQKPELFIRVGNSYHLPQMKRQDITIHLENVLTNQLDQQKADIISEQFEDYQYLFKGKKSISERVRRNNE